MTWIDTLRAAIRDSGKSVYAIAKESGVPQSTVQQVMTGQEPRLGTAEKIAVVVGLKLSRKK